MRETRGVDGFAETVEELKTRGKPGWFSPEHANDLREHIRKRINFLSQKEKERAKEAEQEGAA